MYKRTKRYFYRHHWWLIPAIASTAAFLTLQSSIPDRGTVFIAVVGAGLSALFFVQQQRLAEMNFFRELITTFNDRYDKLNGRLMSIRCEEDCADYQAVLDYFNLCAEEYLFYCEGYIEPKVWRAWCKGMLYYFQAEPFASMWTEEVQSDSYYGLTLDEIYKGSCLSI